MPQGEVCDPKPRTPCAGAKTRQCVSWNQPLDCRDAGLERVVQWGRRAALSVLEEGPHGAFREISRGEKLVSGQDGRHKALKDDLPEALPGRRGRSPIVHGRRNRRHCRRRPCPSASVEARRASRMCRASCLTDRCRTPRVPVSQAPPLPPVRHRRDCSDQDVLVISRSIAVPPHPAEALLHQPMVLQSIHYCSRGVVSSVRVDHASDETAFILVAPQGQSEIRKKSQRRSRFPDFANHRPIRWGCVLGATYAKTMKGNGCKYQVACYEIRGESCEPEGHAAGSQNSGVKRQRTITWPESATRVCPVMVRALSEHRKTAASAMSCPLISRRSAVLFT